MTFRPVRSDADWHAARAIRRRVFIEEQQCPPAEEWDAHDATSRHVLGLVDGTPGATARWRAVRHGGQPAARLERFAVLPAHRGAGYGRRLVRYVMDDARQAGFSVFVLHAQTHLEDFYASFGFASRGDVFEEASIPHVEMILREGGKGEKEEEHT